MGLEPGLFKLLLKSCSYPDSCFLWWCIFRRKKTALQRPRFLCVCVCVASSPKQIIWCLWFIGDNSFICEIIRLRYDVLPLYRRQLEPIIFHGRPAKICSKTWPHLRSEWPNFIPDRKGGGHDSNHLKGVTFHHAWNWQLPLSPLKNPWKMDAWKMILSFWGPTYFHGRLFSFTASGLHHPKKVTNSQNCQVDIRHHWILFLDVATPVWIARPVASSSAQWCPLEEPDQDIPPGSTAEAMGKMVGNPNGMGTVSCVISGRCGHGGCFRVSQEYHFPYEFWGDLRIQRCWILRSREETAGLIIDQNDYWLPGPWNKQRASLPLRISFWGLGLFSEGGLAVSLMEGNWWMPKNFWSLRGVWIFTGWMASATGFGRKWIKWWSVVHSETVWEI